MRLKVVTRMLAWPSRHEHDYEPSPQNNCVKGAVLSKIASDPLKKEKKQSIMGNPSLLPLIDPRGITEIDLH